MSTAYYPATWTHSHFVWRLNRLIPNLSYLQVVPDIRTASQDLINQLTAVKYPQLSVAEILTRIGQDSLLTRSDCDPSRVVEWLELDYYQVQQGLTRLERLVDYWTEIFVSWDFTATNQSGDSLVNKVMFDSTAPQLLVPTIQKTNLADLVTTHSVLANIILIITVVCGGIMLINWSVNI